MKSLLSVIIPIYNVERTLRRCLDSLPVVEGIEVVLIDDGSTDGSAAIAKEYPQFRLIQQENCGLGAARNTGIRHAQGEWITFIDSDDYLAAGTLELLLEEIERVGADILEYSFRRVDIKGKTREDFVPENKVYRSVEEYWNSTKAWRHTYAWNKIFRAEIFKHELWSEGVRFEDASSMPRFLKHCATIATTSIGFYMYCDNPQGLSTTATATHTLSLLKAQWNNFQQYPSAVFYADIVNIQITALQQGATEPSIPLLNFYHTPKLILLHLLGFKCLASVLNSFHSLFNSLKVERN